LLFLVAAAAMLITLVRFVDLWARLRSLLEKVAQVPMVGAFEHLPDEVGEAFRGLMYAHDPDDHDLAAVTWSLPPEQRETLNNDIRANHPALSWVFGRPREGARPAARLDNDLASATARKWLIQRLHELARQSLDTLYPDWVRRPIGEAFGGARPPEGAGANHPGTPDSAPSPHAGPEGFVAAYATIYLGQYFVQLRMLAYALAFSTPLLLFAAAGYDFQPPRPQLNALVALLLATAVGLVYVLYRINRDGLVSRITRTVPHRFTPDMGFLSSVSVYVLPIVAILLAQVLGLFRFVVEPIIGLFQ
jgi:hypothetical protein